MYDHKSCTEYKWTTGYGKNVWSTLRIQILDISRILFGETGVDDSFFN